MLAFVCRVRAAIPAHKRVDATWRVARAASPNLRMLRCADDSYARLAESDIVLSIELSGKKFTFDAPRSWNIPTPRSSDRTLTILLCDL